MDDQPTTNLLPPTDSRVPQHTSSEINRRVQEQIEASVAYHASHPEEIGSRLRELDHEWDIERTLEANAAGFGFLGVMLGSLVDRRWLILPAAVTGFLMQHALQGWCPPLPIFRRRGIRTAREIHEERVALKALRGDFDDVQSQRRGAPHDLLRAVRR